MPEPQATLRERATAAFNASVETLDRRAKQVAASGREVLDRARTRIDERRRAGGRFGRTIELLTYFWYWLVAAFEDLTSYFDTVVELHLEQDPEAPFVESNFTVRGAGGYTCQQPGEDGLLRLRVTRGSLLSDVSVTFQDDHGVSATLRCRPFHRVEVVVTGLDLDGNEQTSCFNRHLNSREWAMFSDPLGRSVRVTRQHSAHVASLDPVNPDRHGATRIRKMYCGADQL